MAKRIGGFRTSTSPLGPQELTSKPTSESSGKDKATAATSLRTYESCRITALPATVTLPITLQSQNKTHYAHWKKGYDYKKEMWRILSYVLPSPPSHIAAMGRRKVIIERRCHRKMDYGNFVGGCKHLMDWLTRMKYIIDDSDKWIDQVYIQTYIRSGEPEEVRLTLEEATPQS